MAGADLRGRVALAFVALGSLGVAGADKVPARPRILGLSHVALRVSNLAASLSFYEDFLGYRRRTVGASEPVFLVVNDRQYIELVPGLHAFDDRLDHLALETDDAEVARRHLAAQGVEVRNGGSPPPVPRVRFTDPEGHTIELMERPRGDRPRTAASEGEPISGRILHAGIIVGDLAASKRFYEDVLGFSEIWRGSRSGTVLSWTNMKVPDGDDYIEFMLYGERPAPNARGTQHHICLEVQDIEAARTRLAALASSASYMRPLEVRIGTNRRHQLNLYDPDGTRIELMEPRTVDGQPVPSSTAPPPRR